MLPLRRVVRWTEKIVPKQHPLHASGRVIFAAGFNFNKLLFCGGPSGEVGILSADKVSLIDATRRPDRPGDSAWVREVAERAGYDKSPSLDGMLCWFEAYAAALTSGEFAVEELYGEVPGSGGICLFPAKGPGLGERVTQGIRIRAAPLFVPELSNLSTSVAAEDQLYFFSYRIGFSLLSEAEQAQQAQHGARGSSDPLRAVQLLDRHWVIRNRTGAVQSEVRGEAVVGQYPRLLPGGPEFTYQSCTHQPEEGDSMWGEFTFVEGSIEEPGRRRISAVCPPFELSVPNFLF